MHSSNDRRRRLEGFEDSVRQPILSHELPDILLAVELGRPRRQLQERYVSGYLEVLRSVPAGLIEEEDRVGAGADFCGDFVQMMLHGFGVAERQNQGSAGSVFRANRTEQIG